MVEYRPVPDDRLGEFRRVLSYAFRPTAGPWRPEPDEDDSDLPGPARIGARRGLFDGDDIRCGAVHHWFEARVRDTWIDLAGLTGVATPPEHRRQGYVSEIVRASLKEYRDRGCGFAALWPFNYSFYRRYGWAQAGQYALTTCPPSALSFAANTITGEFRQLEADEFARLDPVLAAHGAGYELTTRRSPEWWRHRIFDTWEGEPFVYGWVDDSDVRAYLVYRFEERDDGKTRMRIIDHAFADPEGAIQLLRFCHAHDSQVASIVRYGPPNADLFDLVEDPSAVEIELKPGPMVRIVDLETALDGLAVPAGETDPLVVQVEDDTAAWNDGRVRLSVRDERLECEQVPDESPDLVVDLGTLTQVVVGHLPVRRAVVAGDLRFESVSARETLGALFPPRPVFLREGF